MNFKNLDASTFYVTTMGEKQAPARHFFTKCRAQKKSLVGDSQWKAVQDSLPTEWTNCSCISGSWASGINRVDLDSGITNPTSPSHFLCAGAPNQTKAGPESKKLQNRRTVQPARLPGENTSHLFCFWLDSSMRPGGTGCSRVLGPPFGAYLFCSLHYWGVST